MEKYQKLLAIVIVIAVVAVATIVYSIQASQSQESIYIYSGAGMRKPMDEIGDLFENEYGVRVEYNYAGSETLLSQIELTGIGDVYMPGALVYMESAVDKGLIGNQSLVAWHTPIIAVPEGNPANITCLEDLAKPGVEVVLGDAEAAACGKIADRVLQKNGLFDAVNANVITRTATTNELAVYISQGLADAAICWLADLYGLGNVTDMIEIPEEQNINQVIPIGILVCSEKDDLANQFIQFVVSETGQDIFEKYLYPPYEG